MDVIDTQGNKSTFKPRFITNSLVCETGMKKKDAEKIARNISKSLKKIGEEGKESIFTSEIREKVKFYLEKHNLQSEANDYDVIAIGKHVIDDILSQRMDLNANQNFNTDTIQKNLVDNILTQYTLKHVLTEEERNMHIDGYTYCIDGDEVIVFKDDSDNIFIEKIKNFILNYNIDKNNYYVPSFNDDKHKSEWKKIINTGKRNYKEDIYKITFNKGKTLKCTKDHPFFKINKLDKQTIYNLTKKVTIEDYYKSESKTFSIGDLKHISSEYNDITYEGMLIGFALGDGSINSRSMTFSLRKVDKISYLENILNNLKIPFRKKIQEVGCNSATNDYYKFFIDMKYLSFINFDKSKQIQTFNEKDCLGIISGLINSDGHIRLHGSNNVPIIEFTNTNLFIARLFKLLMKFVNIDTSFREYQNNQKKNYKNRYKLTSSGKSTTLLLKKIPLRDNFQKVIQNQDFVHNNYDDILYRMNIESVEKIDYDYVYDITVKDNHNFLVGDNFILTSNCHDLASFPIKINCWSFSPVPVFEKGLYISGDDSYGTITTPPRHLSTAISMIREILTAAGTEQFAGALGIPLFNLWLAPFCRGLSVRDIKQSLQGFIYEMNQSLKRMGEVTFSNINLELGVPKFLENEPAIGPEGKIVGTLKDFEAEAQLITEILIDIFHGGDPGGKPFIFPNCAFSLRDEFKGDERYEYLLNKSFALHTKYPSFYWINQDLKENNGHAISFGCRSSLGTNHTGDWKQDTMFTGNSSFFTLNLPRFGHLANDVSDIYSYMDKYIDLGFTVAEKRTNLFKKNRSNGMYSFTSQSDIHGDSLYNIDNATHAIGYIGFTQMLQNIGIKDGVLDNEGQKITKDMLKFLNKKKKDFSDSTGLRTSVIASPAEYACKKLADIDIEEFGSQNINYGGTKASPYYHNSYHILDQNVDILTKSRIESSFAKYNGGGSILHTWLGQYPSPEALRDLILMQKDMGAFYLTATNSFTCCQGCNNNSNGINNVCPSCNSNDTVSFDKITGYISPISNFNKSKQQEVKDRNRYDL